jgi:hypothetical protein
MERSNGPVQHSGRKQRRDSSTFDPQELQQSKAPTWVPPRPDCQAEGKTITCSLASSAAADCQARLGTSSNIGSDCTAQGANAGKWSAIRTGNKGITANSSQQPSVKVALHTYILDGPRARQATYHRPCLAWLPLSDQRSWEQEGRQAEEPTLNQRYQLVA